MFPPIELTFPALMYSGLSDSHLLFLESGYSLISSCYRLSVLLSSLRKVSFRDLFVKCFLLPVWHHLSQSG